MNDTHTHTHTHTLHMYHFDGIHTHEPHVRLGERERECVYVFERETHIRSKFDVSFI